MAAAGTWVWGWKGSVNTTLRKKVQGSYNSNLTASLEMTIILVTHDIGVVADTATEVACLNKHLHFHGTTEDFKSLDEVEISKIYGHPIQFVDHQHNRECCSS